MRRLRMFHGALPKGGASRLAGRHFARRQQADFRYRIQGPLAVDIEAAQGLDLVVEEFNAIGKHGAHRKQIDESAAHAVFARCNDLRDMLVAGQRHLRAQFFEFEAVALFHEKSVGGEKGRWRQSRDSGRRGDDQHITVPLRDGKQGGQPF